MPYVKIIGKGDSTMYKYLVFFDLDRTLFDENSKVNDEVANAMEEIRKHGGLPVISTGRNIFEIKDTLEKTKIDSVVAANGDFGMLRGKEVFSNTIDPKIIDQLYDFVEQHGNTLVLLNQKRGAITNHDELAIKAFKHVHAPLPKIVTKTYWHENPINMMVVTNTDLDTEYEDAFGDVLTFYRNSPYSIDVVVHGVSKATGIKQLIDTAGLKGIPTYAFGDGNNDIPMLDYVDHPVVMGNGLSNVKPHGEFITTKNTDHGIVNGLKHFNLI